MTATRGSRPSSFISLNVSLITAIPAEPHTADHLDPGPAIWKIGDPVGFTISSTVTPNDASASYSSNTSSVPTAAAALAVNLRFGHGY